MEEIKFKIEPKKGLGRFNLDSTVNSIISEIRMTGEHYSFIKFIASEGFNDPIYIELPYIRLRFDNVTQKLELIEIDLNFKDEAALAKAVKIDGRMGDETGKEEVKVGSDDKEGNDENENENENGDFEYDLLKCEEDAEQTQSKANKTNQYQKGKNASNLTDFNFYYKNDLIFSTLRHNITRNYNSINSIFGVSSLPIIVDKKIILKYDGLSFIFDKNNAMGIRSPFDNNSFNQATASSTQIKEDDFTNCEAPLSKILLYSDLYLRDNREFISIKGFSSIKVELDKGIQIYNSDEEVFIAFNEPLESVLAKLKNPNMIYQKTNQNDEYIYLNYNSTSYLPENNDFFLNYYDLGIDILIDYSSYKVKKIILHSNNPFESNFGIYNRCHYHIELNKLLLKKLEIENTSRKVSEDSAVHMMNREDFLSEDNSGYELNYDEAEGNNDVKETNVQLKIEKTSSMQVLAGTGVGRDSEAEASGLSANDLNLSESLNMSGDLVNNSLVLIITPTTNFQEIIPRLIPGTFVKFQKNDSKLNLVTNFYALDGIIFEIMGNYSMCSITLFKQETRA